MSRIALSIWVAVGLFVLAGPEPVCAQGPAPTLGPQEEPIQIRVEPLYQRFTAEGETLSQRSLQLALSVPLTDRLAVRARAQAATVTTDAGPDLRGLDDTQVGIGYTQPIGEGSLQMQVVANLPTGRVGLPASTLSTTALLSEDLFDVRVSGFGRGLNLSPRLSLALPLGDVVTIGLGGRYRYAQGYRPFANMNNAYVPGNAVTGRGGIDVQLTPTSALSADVSYSHYQQDTVGGEPFFDAGSRYAATLQFLDRFGYNRIRLLVQYRSRETSRLYLDQFTAPQSVRVLPQRAMVVLASRVRILNPVYVGLEVRGTQYRDTDRRTQKAAGEFRLRPEIRFSDSVSLLGRAAYTFIDLQGFEGGIGLRLHL